MNALAETPEVFLAYQQRLSQATREHKVVVCEKSRRIGATWAISADAALTAGARRSAGGMDVWYIGYNLDMTREFIDACALFAKTFLRAAVEVGEFLFRDQTQDGADRDIKAFRIRFASGFEVVALCSRPRSLRGKQGYVILDEAAFHDDLSEALKAALAFLIWGGKVLVISTHDGAENTFNELCQEVLAGKKPYKLLRITFKDAIDDGLFRRVCLVRGLEWSAEAETAWEAEIRAQYGDAAEEELDCVPRRSGGKYLPRTLLEARANPAIPILRWKVDEKFVDLSDDARAAEAREWIKDNLDPVLEGLVAIRSAMGEDFGRTLDITTLWPLLIVEGLRRRTPFVVELRNIPFREQELICMHVLEHLPRLSGAAFDARGNGQYLAERARQKYGASMVAEVMLSEGFYRENFPRLKASLEDATFEIPAHPDTLDDFRTIEIVQGVPRIAGRTGSAKAGNQRHGDSAIAALLADFAAREIDAGPLEWTVEGRTIDTELFDGQQSEEMPWSETSLF